MILFGLNEGSAKLIPDGKELHKLLQLLPVPLQKVLGDQPQLSELLEIVMDLGRPPIARFPHGDRLLSSQPVTRQDLAHAESMAGQFGGDNRAGIDRTLHRISAIRNRDGKVIGLTCRIGRAVLGSAAIAADLARAGQSILLLGRPGVGKTTAIRELARLLASDCNKRVVIVDTSNEIGGDGNIPHPGIGRARRMQVFSPDHQHKVMIEAVENHMPEVIVIDEIGTEAEAVAARTIAQRGVQLVATAHGFQLDNLIKNPALSDLVGGIASVTLGDDEAKRRGTRKSVLERAAMPTFDACIEMLDRDQWRVHMDLATSVDNILAGKQPRVQMRARNQVSMDASEEHIGVVEAAAGWVPYDAGNPALHALQQMNLPQISARKRARGEYMFTEDGLFRDATVRTVPSMTSTLPSAPLRGANDFGALSASSEDDEDEDSSEEGGPDDDARLFLYAHEVEPHTMQDVVDEMGLQGNVHLTGRLQDADAVLAPRSKLKQHSWIKDAAKAAGVPLYTIKTTSPQNLVRGLRTVVGLDPSPGSMFPARFGDAESCAADSGVNGFAFPVEPPASDPEAVDGWEGTNSSGASSSKSRAGPNAADAAPPTSSNAAAGLPHDAISGRGMQDMMASSGAYADQDEAMQEVQSIIERVVVPLQQPVELLPRAADIIELQVAVVKSYQLGFQLVGNGLNTRIRILAVQKLYDDLGTDEP
ncbi:hypothetical protein WJX84_011872 [Apatococcus fuscideae]|uniref:AAA+ ATPase domain-containing protein n=1 Tax=Apatococcus fuscideae TaxID=2026836 RepID=A0AAW1T5Q2_9CHLO